MLHVTQSLTTGRALSLARYRYLYVGKKKFVQIINKNEGEKHVCRCVHSSARNGKIAVFLLRRKAEIFLTCNSRPHKSKGSASIENILKEKGADM
ncbi:hypothetical protein TNCV_4610891 [Trichonephila clavipes]|nr:hypothetical protein TNCV_4610891 [Trichonephila clavipes]